jgi:hypothetical protein
MEEKAAELAEIITYREFSEKGRNLAIKAGYSPAVEHSEQFVEMTGDDNPIHRKHPEYHETISPGLLQNAAAIILINQGIRESGLNASDFPFSHTKAEMKAGVVTGLDYVFEIEIGISSEGVLKSSAALSGPQGIVYNLERASYCKKPKIFFSRINLLEYIHSCMLIGESPYKFGKLIDSGSPESNLYAVSASSSVVSDAVRQGNLNNLEEDVAALYTKQDIYSDARRSLDLKKGLRLFLFLSNPERFGKISGAGEILDMNILAADDNGRVVYLSHAPLAFPRKKIIELQLRKALRLRK